MKDQYDFSKGKRGAVVPLINKERITIRLDPDIIHWFKNQVHHAGGGNYQTRMNEALRQYIEERHEVLEEILRRIIREELHQRAR